MLDDGQKAQRALKGRIDEIVALRSGGLATATERKAQIRAERADMERKGEEIKNLRLENSRIQELADSREKELQRRIRILEIDLDETKEAAREADALRERVQKLSDEVNDRDQIIVRERKERADEQQQLEQARNALLMRLETLEKQNGHNAASQKSSGDDGAAAPQEPLTLSADSTTRPTDDQTTRPQEDQTSKPKHRIFHATPWMSFKK
jgi:DNA repair exonuclease SbcCD ATPase subunit